MTPARARCRVSGCAGCGLIAIPSLQTPFGELRRALSKSALRASTSRFTWTAAQPRRNQRRIPGRHRTGENVTRRRRVAPCEATASSPFTQEEQEPRQRRRRAQEAATLCLFGYLEARFGNVGVGGAVRRSSRKSKCSTKRSTARVQSTDNVGPPPPKGRRRRPSVPAVTRPGNPDGTGWPEQSMEEHQEWHCQVERVAVRVGG